MQKIDLRINSKKYKIVYDRKKHFKDVPNYLIIPYKNHFIIEMWGVTSDLISKKGCRYR